jgi:hypothetical protein
MSLTKFILLWTFFVLLGAYLGYKLGIALAT